MTTSAEDEWGPITKLKATREGGMVQRFHPIPHHGSYSVAEHTFGMLQLILIFHPNPSLNLVRAVMNHDVAERWIGDSPTPVKWFSPNFRFALAEAEEKVETAYDLKVITTQDEHWWLKAADLLELWLWGQEQVCMGNTRAQRLVCNITNAMSDGRAEEYFPAPLLRLYREYEWSMLPEEMPTTPVKGY